MAILAESRLCAQLVIERFTDVTSPGLFTRNSISSQHRADSSSLCHGWRCLYYADGAGCNPSSRFTSSSYGSNPCSSLNRNYLWRSPWCHNICNISPCWNCWSSRLCAICNCCKPRNRSTPWSNRWISRWNVRCIFIAWISRRSQS